MATQYPANRNKELAAIHAAKRDLCMADDAYRDILWAVARVRSAKDLDYAGRMKVLDHFKACGWKPKPKPNEWAFIDHAAADRQPLLRKICAVCRSMGVGKTYAEGAAKRQTGIDRKLELMDQGQLWVLAGVLERTRQHKQEQAK
ncbi:MAG: regulatory protein GemA [Gammaproteobacteria bacterium]|nr:regulatory protein GemA [Gammaproteobacteria bacterium]